jgi:hypothetical protein
MPKQLTALGSKRHSNSSYVTGPGHWFCRVGVCNNWCPRDGSRIDLDPETW